MRKGGGGGGGGGNVSFQRKIPNFLKGFLNADGKALQDEAGPAIVSALADREDVEDEAPMIVQLEEDEGKKKDKKRSVTTETTNVPTEPVLKKAPKKKSRVQLSFKDDDDA